MKPIIIYMALLSLLLMTGCSFIANANGDSQKSTGEPIYDVKIQTEIIEYEEYHITIHYPDTPNNQINQAIIDYVNQKKAAFKKESYEALQKNEGKSSLELHIDYEVLHQDRRFFVVQFEETTDVVPGEPVVKKTIVNFDKENGKRIELNELFKQDLPYVDRLVEFTVEALKADENYSADMEDALKTIFNNNLHIALTGQGIVVYINGVSDFPNKIVLNEKAVDELLRPEYAKALELPGKINKEKPTYKEEDSTFTAEDYRSKHGSSGMKEVALTFDDGPHPEVTTNILEALNEYEAKATFFMIGKRISYYPEVARQVAEAGHEIGNHTWDHPRLSRLPQKEVTQQIDATQQIIKQVTGQKPDVIRLPFGDRPPVTYKKEISAVPWTVEVKDWQKLENSQVAENVLSQVEDGSIILLHDLQPSMAEAVELIVKSLKQEGYTFVTVSELNAE
ncbi:polysaccharide deacetylase family protein [Halobacillus sp. K22]|uniref:polysaccharide deacetylase family protein n=1 Tax=Halobacillus sp. K22 TaxID=3457431 RepID=UPI003FCCA677